MLCKKNIALVILFVTVVTYSKGQVTTNRNVVVTNSVKRPGITTQAAIDALNIEGKLQQVVYFDGLGRPIQTVATEAAPGNKDMISPVEYDGYGREVKKFLAYSELNANTPGSLRTNAYTAQASFYEASNTSINTSADNMPFTQNLIEFSPMNRVRETGAPGETWQPGSTRTIKTVSSFNKATEDVRKWIVFYNGTINVPASTGAYADDDLYKSIVYDEHGKQVITYNDREGKAILKKVQLTETPSAAHAGWLCTYYVYDELNQLRYVLQPKLVEDLPNYSFNLEIGTALQKELCFTYEYDAKGRMIMKCVPGAEKVYMVYDARGRLVLTQDGNQRSQGKWMYMQYDHLNRTIATGTWTNSTDFNTHLSNAYNSTTYPVLSGTWEELTRTFYDDYDWLTTYPISGISANRFTTDDVHLLAASTNAFPFTDAVQQSIHTRGAVTGSRTKILGTDTWISSINYYDKDGRVIQICTQNQTDGIDILTTQYSFSGQILLTVLKHNKNGVPAQTQTSITKHTYDIAGRLLKTEKKTANSTLNGGAIPTYWVTVSQHQYDAIGQLKEKKLGSQKDAAGNYTTTPLETLTYDYNIRGWMLGINRDYLVTPDNQTRWFGMELAYDKTSSKGYYGYYNAAQYNGNITGTLWKTKGDGLARKYDFTYDNVNRLHRANFTQQNGTNWSVNEADFGVAGFDADNNYGIKYDANGNILGMVTKGIKINTPSFYMDALRYTYKPNSNKLDKVTDDYGTTVNKMGDFMDGANGSGADYNYDVNGNLILDHNKAISSITYNHLNLPSVITITGKGNITYTYDAAGNKLKKVTTENATTANNNTTTITTTSYINGFIYETKTINGVVSYTDKLQLTGHEEGRIRPLYNNASAPTTITGFAYDYFIKDHLGNVRMVLTDEQQTNYYPAATLEGTFSTSNPQANSMVNNEKQYYKIDNTKIVAETSIPSWATETLANTKLYYNHNNIPPASPNPNYPAGVSPTQTTGSTKLYKLNATANKTGLEFVIKVMAGDKVDILGKSYYLNTSNITNSNSTPLNLLSLVTNLLLAPVNPIAGKGITATQLNTSAAGIPGTFFRGANSEATTTIPKAYINYILLDEQFKFAGGSFSRVGSSGTVKDHWTDGLQNINVPKNGYLFVYISNESNLDVFFDNLQVVHKPGPLVEETHYYPFGLTMSGISSKAAGSLTNKWKYNGKEEQRQEFSDGSGLETYDFGARNYDQQIGRWHAVDPMADARSWVSPYNFVQNNPISRVDPDGALDGDYYDRQGNHLGSDNIVDDKAYIADGKNADGTFKNAKELSVTNSVLNQFANTIAVESGAEKSGSWQESFGIGLAIRNIANAKNKTIGDALQTEGIFGFRDGGNSTAYKKNAEFSMEAALYSVLGGKDFTNGATKWDGIDFLAWGLNSPNGTPHNKFEEYRSIYIEANIYANYKNSITNTIGSSTKYYGKSYSFPAPVFENMANWKMPSSSVPWFGFMYSTGVRTSNSLDATASFGNSIFWKTIKE